MKINREDFAAVIQKVAALTKNRATMPILGMVKLNAINGRFHATATDLNVFATARCDCKGDLAEICVPPGPLLVLSSYGPDTIDLELVEARLKVTSVATASLSIADANEFPAWPTDCKPLKVTPADFADAVKAVSWAASNKPDRGIDKQTVWIGMDGETMQSGCLDGRRMGYFKKPAKSPKASVFVQAEHCPALLEALSGTDPNINYNETWLEVRSLYFCCAVIQAPQYKFPADALLESKDGCKFKGAIPREKTMQALESMQAIGCGEPYVYGTATLLESGAALDFVGRNNEFHSLVELEPASSGTQSKSLQARRHNSKPNVAGASKRESNVEAQSPITVSFDAALLHNVLRHTPGDTVSWSTDKMAIFFDSENVITALALVRANP